MSHIATQIVTPEIKEKYFTEGYHIFRQVIPAEVIEEQIRGVKRLCEQASREGGPEIRWINRDKGLPDRTSHLLKEEFAQPEFIQQFENTPMIDIAEALFGGNIRIALFGMLASGDGREYIQGWHRDFGEYEKDEDIELQRRYAIEGAQVNMPLHTDAYLQIIPGSSFRYATPEEKAVFERCGTDDMPGQVTVTLEPGDIIFYWPSFYHRGYNPEGKLRWTMHHTLYRDDGMVFSEDPNQRYPVKPEYTNRTRRILGDNAA